MKYQVVRTQARYISIGVPAFQGIIKVVGQNHAFQMGGLEQLLFPIAFLHSLLSSIVKRFPVIGSQKVVFKIEQALQHFDQPRILNRILERLKIGHEPFDFGLGADSRVLNSVAAQAGRMSELRVVMISQNVSESCGRSSARIDVRVRIDYRQFLQGIVDVLSNLQWRDIGGTTSVVGTHKKTSVANGGIKRRVDFAMFIAAILPHDSCVQQFPSQRR